MTTITLRNTKDIYIFLGVLSNGAGTNRGGGITFKQSIEGLSATN